MIETLVLVVGIVLLLDLNRRVKRLEQRLAQGWAEPVRVDDAEEMNIPPIPQPTMAEQGAAAVEPVVSLTEPLLQPTIVAFEPLPVQSIIEDEPAADEEPASAFSFEELFGRRLPIWAGGITLAVAGMLIVKLSIEAGLLSPPVRVFLGMLFGFLLIGAAEMALRQEERVRDPRVRQALAGAGIASLYASILVAATLYHLIGTVAAMVGMAGVTGLALFLALRFGAPCALLGLVGGLAAPALIGSSEPNVPLLSLYLALAVGGLCSLSRGQRWAWLGISALVGGFGWGLVLIVGGALDAPDSISVALYLLLLGVALPMLGFAGGWENKLKLAAAIIAAAQMAALVATGGFALLNWGLFGLISIAMIWLAAREPSLERLPPIGLVIALLLLGAWSHPPIGQFALVMAGAGLIYGVPALRRLWHADGGLIEAAQLGAILLLGLWLPLYHYYDVQGAPTDVQFGLLATVLGALAAGIAALGWRVQGRNDDARFAILAISAAVLLACAATLFLPSWLDGDGIAAVGLGLLLLGLKAEDKRLEPASWVFAGAGLVGALAGDRYWGVPAWHDVATWGAMAALFAAFAWLGRIRQLQAVAQFLAPLFAYGALQAVVPDGWLPLIAPLILVGLAMARIRLVPAMASTLLMIVGWAVVPLAIWFEGVLWTIFGDPLMVFSVPEVKTVLFKLATPAALVTTALWRAWSRLDRRERAVGMGVAALLGSIAAHCLYKHLFAIGTTDSFVTYGLAERILWEALLLGGAALLWRLRRNMAGAAMLGGAAGHFALYTLLIHNPLWSAQAVGPLPLLNLIPLAYAVPVATLLALPSFPTLDGLVPRRARTVAWMAIIGLFAASMLRQSFHGSLLVDPGLSQAEDIARSIVAIALAVGFLLWGIRTGQRDWRIGSLALMLAAVAKVFLWDTQGLEGLIRIASFVALGFSLIGIGWLYSRQLASPKT